MVQGVLSSTVGRWRPASIYWFKALFLPSALNVKVKKFNQARVNGGCNYDSLKVGRWRPLSNWSGGSSGTWFKALFLPSALKVKVKKFNQARVNGGSNYDYLKVGR